MMSTPGHMNRESAISFSQILCYPEEALPIIEEKQGVDKAPSPSNTSRAKGKALKKRKDHRKKLVRDSSPVEETKVQPQSQKRRVVKRTPQPVPLKPAKGSSSRNKEPNKPHPESTNETPAKEAPVKGTPVKGTPVKEAPVKGRHVKEAHLREAHVKAAHVGGPHGGDQLWKTIQSSSIDSQPAPSDGAESAEREASISDDDSSDSDSKETEPMKSSQWLDFQAMADRITTTVKQTSTSMQKLRDTTNVTKLVKGLIKEEMPEGTEGAWDKVDDEVDTSCSSSNEFEDDYDPKAEADLVGKAFGDYKDAKKRKKEAGQTGAAGFEDTYDPGVDVNDPLAGAFGDGFRTSKPVQAPSCNFDDDFSAATTSPRVEENSQDQTTGDSINEFNSGGHKSGKTKLKTDKSGQATSKKPTRPAPPLSSANSDSNRSTSSKSTNETSSTTTKRAHTVPSTKPMKPPSPQKPPQKPPQRPSQKPLQKPSASAIETDNTQPSCDDEVDLLGGLTENCNDSTLLVSAEVNLLESYKEPSNLDLLLGNVEETPTAGFNDAVLEELELTEKVLETREVARLRMEMSTELSSRSSSTDQLDAFEFFTGAAPESDSVDNKGSSLQPSPQINIIAPSVENLATSDMLELDMCQPSTSKEADGGRDLDSVSSSSSESESDQPGPFSATSLGREDTLDFDEIMSRPVAKDISETKLSSEVWAGTDDSGIGVEFKATFSVSDELEEGTFTGNQTFETLIEKYEGIKGGSGEFEMGTKSRAEVTGSQSVSAKRAMKFARTFSETIDEDDDGPLSGLGLVVDPMEKEGEEGDEKAVASGSSIRHVWIDMTKPMPRAQPKPLNKKDKSAKPPPSSIKLLSQEARQSLHVNTKPVPRPKALSLEPSAETSKSTESAESTVKSSTKKLVTQGQADHLNLSQLKEHTTLAFEIEKRKKKKKHANKKSVELPTIPPPPKNSTPSQIRKNPFTQSESSSSEEAEEMKSDKEEEEVDNSLVRNEKTLPLAEDKNIPIHKWEALEKVDLPPLEEFRPKYEGHGWKMLIRKPPKKSLTKKRFWEEVYLRLEIDSKGCPCLLLYRNEKDAKKGAKELERARLNPFHQLSDSIYLQQYDQYGKCHSIKILHVSYKERPSLRGDRVTEALPNFLKGYMKPTKTMMFEHAPTVTELYKFGSLDYRSMRMFVWELEDALQHLQVERINTNTMYQKNEIIADAWDEYEACIDREGHIVSHKARVRLFMICFISGMPIIEVGINDRRRRGKEVVRRHEIIPVKAENWITVEDVELHHIVKEEEYKEDGVIRFRPLDGNKFEFMRFRYRPKKNRELPLQIATKMVVDREKLIIELRADVLIPGYYSNSKRKGQVPCENIQICFPIPEPWIYKFRVEKHQKMGSLHAAARKPGKVKGLERITTAFGKVVESYLPPSFIECSVGDAKYEHIFRSVVWRIEKLPRFNEGAYKSHYFALRLQLEKHDVIPDSFEPHIQVEFVMPHTTVSGTAIRSISCPDVDETTEKWVHHHARYEYTVEIDFQSQIRQLLPDETPSQGNSTTQAEPTHVNSDEEDNSSIDINEGREDSDDTDTRSSSTEAPEVPEEGDSAPIASEGYTTLLDLNTDQQANTKLSNTANLLDL
ncbi:stnB [Bugula neritina]|uniref:StnB n=1 Tax=Bugula neritina TaxID=10212 RepID=A0A7J7KNC7_BUGNE|nr:stnB [Bugula neritina]